MAKKLTEKVKRVRRANKLGSFQNSARKELQSELNYLGRTHQQIVDQVNAEYDLAWRFCLPKIKEGLSRLKLYNNQRRDKDKVGDPLLFSTHQTVLAAIYNDQLAVEFLPREEGDEDAAINLNGLSEYDYDEMGKAILDYWWDWDAFAWGRGLVYFDFFDRDTKTPIPQVWDPLTFVRDPDATSVNGDRLGEGALLFGGREAYLTKWQMEANPEYVNLNRLEKPGNSSFNSLVFEARQARRQAQGLENLAGLEQNLAENYKFGILQWFTHIDGEKCIVELANNRSLAVRVTPLESKKWPLVDRACYPMSHDWDGVSVFDMVEDKQRYRAALLNVFGDSARADLYPMRLFDYNKVKRSEDKNYAFNKWIGVNGNPNDAVLNLAPAGVAAKAQWILDFLDVAAQKATATPEIQQGQVSSKDRTLGELELVSSKVDTRYSLTAKLFGISEKNFWRRWYEIYERDFTKGIDKKVMRIMGTFGPAFRPLKRDDIVTINSFGPDIKIESRQISEAKKIRSYAQMKDYMLAAFTYPEADRLYGLRHLGKKIMPKDEVERLLPLTVDEREAKKENEQLSNDESVKVDPGQNHLVHLRMHAAAEDTEATKAHIKAHETALILKRLMPQHFPVLPEEAPMPPNGNPPVANRPTLTRPAPEGATGPSTL